jgi:hypothetical protein
VENLQMPGYSGFSSWVKDFNREMRECGYHSVEDTEAAQGHDSDEDMEVLENAMHQMYLRELSPAEAVAEYGDPDTFWSMWV